MSNGFDGFEEFNTEGFEESDDNTDFGLDDGTFGGADFSNFTGNSNNNGNIGFSTDDGLGNSGNAAGQGFGHGMTGNQPQQQDFSGAFDVNEPVGTSDTPLGIKKQSLIFIAIGVIALIIVVIIATAIGKSSKKKEAAELEAYANQVQVQEQQTQQNLQSNVNVDNVMQDGNVQEVKEPEPVVITEETVVTNVVEDGYTWTTITDSESVQFNEEYTDMLFTVTGIEHRARAVDVNNNLLVKTTLTGSISGLSGNYTLDIPYNKGVKLVVGNSFTVHVQLGQYNGKTVVGEIKY